MISATFDDFNKFTQKTLQKNNLYFVSGGSIDKTLEF